MLELAGGLKNLFLILIAYTTSVVIMIYINFFTRQLSSLEGQEQKYQFGDYCKLIFGFTLLQCFSDSITKTLIINSK